MITQLIRSQRFVDEKGKLPQRQFDVMRGLIQLDPLSGSGSPEGVIEASIKRFYMDTGGSAGSILYIKKLADVGGDRTKGWILV